MNRGFVYAIVAYILWGFLPVYWKALQAIPALEIVLNRIIWSLVFLVILLSVRRQWSWLKDLRGQWQTLIILGVSAGLLAVNWLTYVWGVNQGYVVETSLGYFINPLVSVALGVIVLREHLSSAQRIAVGIAVIAAILVVTGLPIGWLILVVAIARTVRQEQQKAVVNLIAFLGEEGSTNCHMMSCCLVS